jgi:hypothetical protein
MENVANVCKGEVNAKLIERARDILKDVQFFQYGFNVRESHGGVFLQGVYTDNDIYRGVPEAQFTRKWLLSPEMTESEIVSTAFKLCLTSMEHRTREGFMYKGARIYGPHFDVNDLVRLCTAEGRESAGGRVEAYRSERPVAEKSDYKIGCGC